MGHSQPGQVGALPTRGSDGSRDADASKAGGLSEVHPAAWLDERSELWMPAPPSDSPTACQTSTTGGWGEAQSRLALLIWSSVQEAVKPEVRPRAGTCFWISCLLPISNSISEKK